MDEKLARTIANLKDWGELASFESNARSKDRLTDEISDQLKQRSIELAKTFVAEKTGLDLAHLSPAEEKIVEAVGEYAAIMKRKGIPPSRTLQQIKNRGLIGAAEASVSHATPTQGYQNLADESKEELSYEQIVIDHPEEFSSRAVWYARRTLGLPNDSDVAPADVSKDVQVRTVKVIEWLKEMARENDGVIPEFTNADTAAHLGMHDLQRYGRVLGNIQSRLDFACYQCELPPLGLAAAAPFERAWSQEERDWMFPVASMQSAAQNRVWSDDDFDRVLRATEGLPGQAHHSWVEELSTHGQRVKDWAYGFGTSQSDLADQNGVEVRAKRNPIWSRDELILALDLYLRHRGVPPAKDSDEVIELSNFLNQMSKALGVAESDTYRNANGVHMKLMNFMHRDPDYIRDGRVGLSRGNKDEEIVWGEFASDPARLAAVVAAIRAIVFDHATDHALEGDDEPDIQEAEEGQVLTKLHRYRERDRKLVTSKKSSVLKQAGRLVCEACGFDFSEKYGPSAAGIIDIHHTKPVHTLLPGDKTRLEDLALICANCHRVVHSKKNWLTIDQVRELLDK